jgi:hypothetical protein
MFNNLFAFSFVNKVASGTGRVLWQVALPLYIVTLAPIIVVAFQKLFNF